MTRPRILLGLCLALTLLVIAIWIARDAEKSPSFAFDFGDVTRLEILYQKTVVALERPGKHWEVSTFDGQPAQDRRANQGLVTHLVDLIGAIRHNSRIQLDAKDAKQYGMANPHLAVTLGWDQPSPGEEALFFGNTDLSGKNVFLFAPKKSVLTMARANVLRLLEGKTALDFRDRRVTTFEPDDVEDLKTTAGCGGYWLRRDGDQWQWKKTPANRAPQGDQIDRWLETLLAAKYETIDELTVKSAKEPSLKELCTVTLIGLRQRTETIQLFGEANGTLWGRNSALPSSYTMSPGYLDQLRLNDSK